MIPDVERRYLREIYDLEKQGNIIIGPKDIADRFNISRATAHEYLMKLTKKGYLKHIPRKGFCLSDKGKRLVNRLIRNHRILETMLVETIGLNLDDACEFAREVENRVSIHIVERIYDQLGKPGCCPHGEPIPKLDEC